jgi:hypothetical protein
MYLSLAILKGHRYCAMFLLISFIEMHFDVFGGMGRHEPRLPRLDLIEDTVERLRSTPDLYYPHRPHNMDPG